MNIYVILAGGGWVESNGPEGGLLQLSAGETSLWGVTRDRKCWILKGNLQPATNNPGTPFEWIEIPGKMKSISVSNSDQVRLVAIASIFINSVAVMVFSVQMI